MAMAAENSKPTPDEVTEAGVLHLEDVTERYPDYTFVLSDTDMLDGALFSASHDKRLRAVLRELGRAGPEFTELAIPSNRRSALDRARKYFGGRIKHNGELVRRDEAIDIIAAEDKTLHQLEEINHPVAQIIERCIDSYGDKLPAQDIHQLTSDLLFIAAFPQLKHHCQEQLRA